MNERICGFAGCGRKMRALGLCTGHVRQHYIGRGLRPIWERQILRPHNIVDGEVNIFLTRGKVAIVDLIDVDLALFNWNALPGGDTWYPFRSTKNEKFWLHRMIAKRMGMEIDDLFVDHKDRDGLNCRRNNLRPATVAQNIHNSRAPTRNSSGYKGVCWHRSSGTWMARIMLNGRRHHLGHFESKIAAGMAYADAAVRLHGEFARTA